MEELGSITGRIKPITVIVTASLLDVQHKKSNRENVKSPPCVVDKSIGGSLNRRPRGLFAVSRPRQLGEQFETPIKKI